MEKSPLVCQIRRIDGPEELREIPRAATVSDLLILLDEPGGVLIYAGSKLDNDLEIGQLSPAEMTTFDLITDTRRQK